MSGKLNDSYILCLAKYQSGSVFPVTFPNIVNLALAFDM
jgi:hypothetical protein